MIELVTFNLLKKLDASHDLSHIFSLSGAGSQLLYLTINVWNFTFIQSTLSIECKYSHFVGCHI